MYQERKPADGSRVDVAALFAKLGLHQADEKPLMDAWRAANIRWRQERERKMKLASVRIENHLRRYARRSDKIIKTPGRRRAVWCVELRRCFRSMSEAAAFVGRKASNVNQSLTGGGVCGPYHWEFYDPRKHG